MDDYAPLKGLKKLGPWQAVPISAADGQMAVLARRVEGSGERIALVDEDDRIVAVVVSLPELEDLEDHLAVAQNELDRRDGKGSISGEEMIAKLKGLG
ncbi:hypothetical protein ACL02R_00690 [Streptomyces sp. MS19]|uniref:hypothetical protein n=1 Tax=Streptomyces sp. MS19 TaxID=3385972 RepID=UPI00399EFC8F